MFFEKINKSGIERLTTTTTTKKTWGRGSGRLEADWLRSAARPRRAVGSRWRAPEEAPEEAAGDGGWAASYLAAQPRRVLAAPRGTGKPGLSWNWEASFIVAFVAAAASSVADEKPALGPRGELFLWDAEDSVLVVRLRGRSGPVRSPPSPSTSDGFAEIHPCLKSIKPC